MKVIQLMWLLSALTGCAGPVGQYGPPPHGGEQPARLQLRGGKAEPPYEAFAKLQLIGADRVWDWKMAGYDLAAGPRELRYSWNSGTGNWDMYFKDLIYPYKIQAELKAGYVYVPILPYESKPPNELCLFGEPIGAPGQRKVHDFVVLSKAAQKIACGSVDRSVRVVDTR
ncbi:hypothetical protein [Variovorax fucosicus]|uniref:hypothetical protein n=1 Tax=Variovorax fucosicus TaxID=3053517 RepID=UPI002577E948|nr:hypothetical protein [Variovorax sp. J22G47]MDM0056835.1 hypothetical protein [Variovorax sp. J22G47]